MLNKDLYSVLLDQARVRTGLGIPVCGLILAASWYMAREGPFDEKRLLQLFAMTLLYLVYNLGSFVIAKKRLFCATHLVVATAVLDPLMLSAWLVLADEAAPLFIGFYIFTILGFGFRVGTQAMWIGQASSVLGFAAAIAVSDFWRSNLTVSASVLVLLVAVPMYATILIKKLLHARELAESESKAKSKLLANVSHKLRTPLHGIVASAQLLKNGKRDSETVSHSDTILQLSNDLLREIDDLLDSAKYHANSTEIIEAPFDLQDVARHLHLALSPSAEAKGIRLHIETDSAIVDGMRSDKHCLTRVLMNIAGNAVKFTEEGEVHIKFALLENRPRAYKVRFSVRDTGIGIPLSEQVRVFEPFYRIPAAVQGRYPGTGLGMSIAYDIVTALGSTLCLESEPEKGSFFYFDLLLPIVSEFPVVPKEAIGTSVNPTTVLYEKRILAVEDHPINCMLLKKILEIDRHAVTIVATGKEALKLLGNNDFDLIILDYNLEDMDGMAVMQQYHLMQKHHALVCFLTADATGTTKENLMQKGAADVLHKPLTLEALRRVIADCSNSSDALNSSLCR